MFTGVIRRDGSPCKINKQWELDWHQQRALPELLSAHMKISQMVLSGCQVDIGGKIGKSVWILIEKSGWKSGKSEKNGEKSGKKYR